MFCPQCGQQQASDAARFCSRCGFQLGAVAGLLATNGAAPEPVFEAVPAPDSPKRKGVKQGGKLMLAGMFLAPALAAFSDMVNAQPEVALIGVIVLMAGLFRLLYALIFEDGPYRRHLLRQPSHVPSAQFAATPREAAALPPQQSARAYAPPRTETAELAYRPSVTEGTTRLLDREPEEKSR